MNTLTTDDAEAIARECTAVSYASPVYGGSAQAVYGNQNWGTSVTGTTPDYLFVRDWSIASGNIFTEQDVRSAIKVGVFFGYYPAWKASLLNPIEALRYE